MVKIRPFAAVRPPKQYVEEVAARPYDVLNSAEAKAEAMQLGVKPQFVDDAITHFKSDVLLVDDSDPSIEEPIVKRIDGYEIEYNVSDGMGFVTPEMSAKWAQELNEGDEPLSGVNTRCSFLKGMLFTIPFVEFAEEVAHTYKIIDAWGVERDVRDADAIITVSMLKLWDSYPSYEAYYENCIKNGYEFAVAKSTPHKLRNVHTTNYQYLQEQPLIHFLRIPQNIYIPGNMVRK